MAKNCLLISDTLLVLAEGAEVLTRGITRAYGDISYYLEDEEEATTVTNAVKNDQTAEEEIMVCKNVIIVVELPLKKVNAIEKRKKETQPGGQTDKDRQTDRQID